MKRTIILRIATVLAVVGLGAPCFAQQSAGLNRLFERANLQQNQAGTDGVRADSHCEGAGTCLVPSTIEATDRIRRASYDPNEGLSFGDPSGFSPRPNDPAARSEVMPIPVGYGKRNFQPGSQQPGLKFGASGGQQWNPNARQEEYVFDGNDRGEKVRVDQNWNIYGLQTEDTIGHFDTLDGRRIVTPSNRVAIYAPRFGAVRRVDGIFKARLNQPVGAYAELTPIAGTTSEDISSTTKQHLALNRYEGSRRASEFMEEQRGVVSDNVTHLFGVRNAFEPFENLSLIRFGRYSKAESARLNVGIMSGIAWEHNLGLQVTVQKATPVITKDVAGVEELITVESEDGTAILRVTKVASKIAAKTGEFVDFTIRFDNLSKKRIGNVTIIDNLTTRLEYVPETAECSVKADFITKRNEGDSLMLRWEIVDPLPGGEGGIIRFRCRVR